MREIIWVAFVAVLAILVFCGALLLPVLHKALSRNNRLLRGMQVLFIVLYVLVILYLTVLFRRTSYTAQYQLAPFWSYRMALALTSRGLVVTNGRLLVQIILNILLYIPLGYLLPFAWPQLTPPHRVSSRPHIIRMFASFPWKIVLIGTMLSTATEFAQLFFRLGLFELDDIFNNTLGCLIGVILYLLLIRPKVKQTA